MIELNKEARTLVDKLGQQSCAVAEARREFEDTETNYRSWRATQFEDIIATNGKLAEWKAKAALESMPGYVKHRRAVAEAREILDLCEFKRQQIISELMLLAAINGSNNAQWSLTPSA